LQIAGQLCQLRARRPDAGRLVGGSGGGGDGLGRQRGCGSRTGEKPDEWAHYLHKSKFPTVRRSLEPTSGAVKPAAGPAESQVEQKIIFLTLINLN